MPSLVFYKQNFCKETVSILKQIDIFHENGRKEMEDENYKYSFFILNLDNLTEVRVRRIEKNGNPRHREECWIYKKNQKQYDCFDKKKDYFLDDYFMQNFERHETTLIV